MGPPSYFECFNEVRLNVIWHNACTIITNISFQNNSKVRLYVLYKIHLAHFNFIQLNKF